MGSDRQTDGLSDRQKDRQKKQKWTKTETGKQISILSNDYRSSILKADDVTFGI